MSEDEEFEPVDDSPPVKAKRGKTAVIAASLVEGKIESHEVSPETTTKEITKMMKVTTITRTPEGRIAEIDLRNSKGQLFNITIDEGTARAMAAVFDG